jgi:uncharacterized protein YpuA (DUF1002 family)
MKAKAKVKKVFKAREEWNPSERDMVKSDLKSMYENVQAILNHTETVTKEECFALVSIAYNLRGLLDDWTSVQKDLEKRM